MRPGLSRPGRGSPGRRARVPAVFAGALALLLVVSCTNPVCGCPPDPGPAVIFHGQVTDPAGVATPGATVVLEGVAEECDGPGGDGSRVLTGPDGRFRMSIRVLGMPPEVCLRAHATPPSGRELWASDTVVVRPPHSGELPDSLHANFRLRAIWP